MFPTTLIGTNVAKRLKMNEKTLTAHAWRTYSYASGAYTRATYGAEAPLRADSAPR